ncbi:MAG: alpha/beta fold hydrolase [Halieaceae bacterium]
MSASIQTVHGTTRLAFDAVEGITNSVEKMHETIARHPMPWSKPPAAPSRAHGLIASAVYATIRATNSTLRGGVDLGFGLLPEAGDSAPGSSTEIKMTAALNGAFGDHLEVTDNPMATDMGLRTSQQPLTLAPDAIAAALPQASPQLVVFVHGLSLSELSWHGVAGPSLGEQLQSNLDCTTLYLRYNTGRHISSNGQDLAQLLSELCAAWPVPVESLSLVGHSMGGLVIRSACWYAEQTQSNWLEQLQRVVCLGTPHHGSPVERLGHALDVLMQKTQYTEPLAFGRQRSAGIKDLRHGNLLDEDWQGHHPDQPRPDTRQLVPLLPGVDYYFAAATIGRDKSDPVGHVLGDLLVRLDSAVGTHHDDLRKLHIKPENCAIFHEKHHFDLLSDAKVHQQIVDWFR